MTPRKCARHELRPGELADSARYLTALIESRRCLACRAWAARAWLAIRRHGLAHALKINPVRLVHYVAPGGPDVGHEFLATVCNDCQETTALAHSIACALCASQRIIEKESLS